MIELEPQTVSLTCEESSCFVEEPGLPSSEARLFAWRADFSLGESPVWSGGRLACVDITGPGLWQIDPESGTATSAPLPVRATAITPIAGGGFLVAAGARLLRLDPALIRLQSLPVIAGWPDPETVFNDAVADTSGRLWIGTRHEKRLPGRGAAWAIEVGQRPVVFDRGLTMPNGIAWFGDTLYLSDSRRHEINGYTDWSGAAFGMRRTLVRFEREDGKADGLTVDAEGHIWCAMWNGGAVRRYAPDGRLEKTIRLPAARPTSVAFGDGGMLFITTAGEGADAGPCGGCLLAVETGVAGLPADLLSPDWARLAADC